MHNSPSGQYSGRTSARTTRSGTWQWQQRRLGSSHRLVTPQPGAHADEAKKALETPPPDFEVIESAPSASSAGSDAPPPRLELHLTPARRRLNWEKWEDRVFASLQESRLQGDRNHSAAAGAGEAQPDSASTASTSTSSSAAAAPRAELSASQRAALADALYLRRYDDVALRHAPAVSDRGLLQCFRSGLAAAAAAGRLRGSVVLDVGCGAGALTSMLAARGGARHVYAVEASPAAAAVAAAVVRANGLSDVVSVVTGRLEDLDRGALPAADVLLSAWMGPFLTGGGMLGTVMTARDRFLAPGGLLLPSTATLHLCGVEDRSYWAAAAATWGQDVLSLDLSAALPHLTRMPRPGGLTRPSQVATDVVVLNRLDLATLESPRQLSFKRPFVLTAKREERLTALMAHWDVGFGVQEAAAAGRGGGGGGGGGGGAVGSSGGGDGEEAAAAAAVAAAAAKTTTFSTSPSAPASSFRQLFFDFPRPIRLAAGEQLAGTLSCAPCGPCGRDLEVDIEVQTSPQGRTARARYELRADSY